MPSNGNALLQLDLVALSRKGGRRGQDPRPSSALSQSVRIRPPLTSRAVIGRGGPLARPRISDLPAGRDSRTHLSRRRRQGVSCRAAHQVALLDGVSTALPFRFPNRWRTVSWLRLTRSAICRRVSPAAANALSSSSGKPASRRREPRPSIMTLGETEMARDVKRSCTRMGVRIPSSPPLRSTRCERRPLQTRVGFVICSLAPVPNRTSVRFVVMRP
jgi:hypothetical protein